MEEYKKVFASNLQSNLKPRIKGKIFVTVTRTDGVYIQITKQEDSIEFTTHINNLSDRLLNGYSVSYAVYEVMTQYKDYIKKIIEERYFYND